MKVERFLTPYMRSYSYVITEGDAAIVIDPCEMKEIGQLLQECESRFTCCILTHEHYDHISGLDWMHRIGVPVIASKACGENLKSPKLNQSRYYDLFCLLQKRLEGDAIPNVREYRGYADHVFEAEASFEWNGHNVFLKCTPGHSEGSICILIDDRYLFSGDTLFPDRETNCGILGGSMEQLKKISMPWLLSLDPSVIVYPGHYEVFRLGERGKEIKIGKGQRLSKEK